MFSGFHLRQFQHNPRNIPRTQKHQLFMIRKSFSYLDSGYLSGMLCLGYVINRVCWNFLSLDANVGRGCVSFVVLHCSTCRLLPAMVNRLSCYWNKAWTSINKALLRRSGVKQVLHRTVRTPCQVEGLTIGCRPKQPIWTFFKYHFFVEQTLLGGGTRSTLQFWVGFWDGYVFLFEKCISCFEFVVNWARLPLIRLMVVVGKPGKVREHVVMMHYLDFSKQKRRIWIWYVGLEYKILQVLFHASNFFDLWFK